MSLATLDRSATNLALPETVFQTSLDVPTPSEIAARCAAIRGEWSPAIKKQRRVRVADIEAILDGMSSKPRLRKDQFAA